MDELSDEWGAGGGRQRHHLSGVKQRCSNEEGVLEQLVARFERCQPWLCMPLAGLGREVVTVNSLSILGWLPEPAGWVLVQFLRAVNASSPSKLGRNQEEGC